MFRKYEMQKKIALYSLLASSNSITFQKEVVSLAQCCKSDVNYVGLHENRQNREDNETSTEGDLCKKEEEEPED